ncbi:flavin monoamine oxidase family protein [Pseudomonas paralcaligenes]|uniref:flavin monoamine oxidase family protein n=1 Tax=Pseudomonas paralcaligenes TaxID=2772558 RepID=UPI0021D002BA|nr:FAD-dependent oxidoreductase [Pseudomonas paralcaligenes]
MSSIEQSWDVIIVGAGVSGLRAALDLKKAGQHVLVLEARSRVGGRSMPGTVAGHTVDFGGQWLGAEHHLFREQAQNLGVGIYPQHTEGNNLVSLDDSVQPYGSQVPKLPWSSLLSLGIADQILQHDLRQLGHRAPWEADNAAELDRESLEAWIDRKVHTKAARGLIKLIAKAILCAEPSEVSYLFFLEVLRQGHGLETMIGVQGGAQQDKFVGGAWQVPKRMADLLTEQIRLNCPVHAIEQDTQGVRVLCAQGTLHARRVIVTVPPVLASRISYEPALPAKRASLIRRMPMGCVIKIHVAYATPFWRSRGLSGAVISPDRALSMVFDQTPPNGEVGILVGLIEGEHAVELSEIGADARRARVMADLVHYFGADADQPLEYVDHDWIHETWTEGGYGAHMPPGVMTTYGETIREPHGRIHWAGTETATEWMGYFEGAMQSGIRAASEVLEAGRQTAA